MDFLIKKIFRRKPSETNKDFSLSYFFPRGTVFFYGYPSGEESGFMNLVSPDVEEIVAARPNACAGSDVKVVNFASTTNQSIDADILTALGLDGLDEKQQIIVPKEISADIRGAERNRLMKDFLKKSIPEKSLIMAQPYTDDDFSKICQIDPKITAWLNDKKNMYSYIKKDLLPKQLGLFNSGAELAAASTKLIAPVVIKITSSSAGDGVYICRDATKLKTTIEKLINFQGSISVEEYIEAKKNYGVQFGVPHDGKQIQIIGVSEQITTDEGEFLGGIAEQGTEIPSELEEVVSELLSDILPFVRRIGWYGIGCFDVLISDNRKPAMIDSNFRMTGMSALLFMKKQTTDTNILSFGGIFNGTVEDFKKTILPIANKSNGLIKIVALSKRQNTWRLNAAIPYSDDSDLLEKCQKIRQSSIISHITDNIEEIVSA